LNILLITPRSPFGQQKQYISCATPKRSRW
jgi:hypothetical protein